MTRGAKQVAALAGIAVVACVLVGAWLIQSRGGDAPAEGDTPAHTRQVESLLQRIYASTDMEKQANLLRQLYKDPDFGTSNVRALAELLSKSDELDVLVRHRMGFTRSMAERVVDKGLVAEYRAQVVPVVGDMLRRRSRGCVLLSQTFDVIEMPEVTDLILEVARDRSAPRDVRQHMFLAGPVKLWKGEEARLREYYLEWLASGDEEEQCWAIRGLSRVGGRKSIEAIRTAFRQSASMKLRQWAASVFPEHEATDMAPEVWALLEKSKGWPLSERVDLLCSYRELVGARNKYAETEDAFKELMEATYRDHPPERDE